MNKSKKWKVTCPACSKTFYVTDEGSCPKCGYFYRIKSRESYKWDGML